MAGRTLTVKILGDDKSLQRAFRSSSRGAAGFQKDMGGVTRGAIAGSGALGGLARSLAFASGGFLTAAAAAGAIKAAFTELNESRKVAAQTAAVIKSTGQVAGVTAEHVEELGRALLRKTGIDDEQIKTAANLLLTFTNVRNVVGASNDVFDQAAQAALDLSVRFDKDLAGSAIVVGKALNDPVRGVTALRRVGVQLTKQQEAQIRTLVASGNVLRAQKIILRELAVETGGAAEAAGRVQPWNLLKETILNVGADIAEKFLPNIIDATDRLQAWFDNPANVERIETNVEKVAGAFVSVVEGIDKANSAATKIDRAIGGAFRSVADSVTSVVPGLESVNEKLRDGALDARNAAAALLGYNAALEESLAIKNRPRPEADPGAAAPGVVPPAPKAGATAAQRNAWFDAVIGRKRNRVQDEAELQAQIASLGRIAGLIQDRLSVTKDITRRLKLEDELRDIGRQQKALREEIAANQVEEKRLAEERRRERIEAARAKIARRQFATLGLGPTGADLVPNKESLRKTLGTVSDAVRGTVLDTSETKNMLARIRKVLGDPFTKVGEEVRSTVARMLDDVKSQLEGFGYRRTIARQKMDPNKLLAGLGLSPEELKAVRGRLSRVGPGGTVAGRGTGAFGMLAPAGGGWEAAFNIYIDGKPVEATVTKRQTVRKARNPVQKRGTFTGR